MILNEGSGLCLSEFVGDTTPSKGAIVDVVLIGKQPIDNVLLDEAAERVVIVENCDEVDGVSSLIELDNVGETTVSREFAAADDSSS